MRSVVLLSEQSAGNALLALVSILVIEYSNIYRNAELAKSILQNTGKMYRKKETFSVLDTSVDCHCEICVFQDFPRAAQSVKETLEIIYLYNFIFMTMECIGWSLLYEGAFLQTSFLFCLSGSIHTQTYLQLSK